MEKLFLSKTKPAWPTKRVQQKNDAEITSGRCQHGHQSTTAVKRHQVIAATNVGRSDEYLGHCAASRQLHHLGAFAGVGVNANLVNVFDALGLENFFRLNAVRANGSGVHLDGLHGG
jgi:hypothetical protein